MPNIDELIERIQQLQAEGHPVFPGALGENVTVSGLDWESVQPGCRFQLGDQVVLEVSRFTTPCNNLIDSFIEGDFGRILQDKYPGWSRVYARVIQEGTIQTGDCILFIPAREN